MIAAGIPLWPISVGIWTLPPQLAGRGYIWHRYGGAAEEFNTPHGTLSTPGYLNSPVRHVSEGLGGVRQRLDVAGATEFRFFVMEELR